jgi:transforming growth factor-beta-induced protein
MADAWAAEGRKNIFGQPLTVNAGSPPVIVDTSPATARITSVDIIASNGVVHVIDKVLLPVLPAAAP